MNNCFNHFNNENNNAADVEPRMTSLEIATLTGKQHSHVMEAIRKMEPAWLLLADENRDALHRHEVQRRGSGKTGDQMGGTGANDEE